MTAGWGETEVPMDVSSRRLALVLHRHLAEHGLLVSFLEARGAAQARRLAGLATRARWPSADDAQRSGASQLAAASERARLTLGGLVATATPRERVACLRVLLRPGGDDAAAAGGGGAPRRRAAAMPYATRGGALGG